MFGGTTRAVATMAMAVKTKMSFVSIAIVAWPLEVDSVVWVARDGPRVREALRPGQGPPRGWGDDALAPDRHRGRHRA